MLNKFLIQTTDVYRVPTVADAEELHEELLKNPNFTLVAFGYKTKFIKIKGEIVDEYQMVTAKKVFNEEKDPTSPVDIQYVYGSDEKEEF